VTLTVIGNLTFAVMCMYASGAYVASLIMYPIKNMREFTNGLLADSASTYPSDRIQTYLPNKWFYVAHLLDAFAKLRKTTTSFVMSIRPSVRQHGTTRLPLDGFSWNLISEDFSKSVEKIQVSLKSDTNKGHFTWRPIYIFLIISRSFLLRMRNAADKSCREYQITHYRFSIFFFRKSFRLWGNVVKYCRAGRAQMTILHAGYLRLQIHTPRLCNIHCSSTGTNVARTRLNVPLYVHCLFVQVYCHPKKNTDFWKRPGDHSCCC
jgi:hypothetical protein